MQLLYNFKKTIISSSHDANCNTAESEHILATFPVKLNLTFIHSFRIYHLNSWTLVHHCTVVEIIAYWHTLSVPNKY